MKNLPSIRHPITIQFYDLDPMNVVWHGNYMRFFESARSELLDLLDYNYKQMKDSGYIWPVVDFRIKYIRPLQFGQKAIVEASLVEYQNRLKIEYKIFDEKMEQVLTKAHSIQVAVKDGQQEMEFLCPADFVERVEKAIA